MPARWAPEESHVVHAAVAHQPVKGVKHRFRRLRRTLENLPHLQLRVNHGKHLGTLVAQNPSYDKGILILGS